LRLANAAPDTSISRKEHPPCQGAAALLEVVHDVVKRLIHIGTSKGRMLNGINHMAIEECAQAFSPWQERISNWTPLD